jgi:2-hydroxycyclohexanecarboxyl-CoA dehydrogenase
MLAERLASMQKGRVMGNDTDRPFIDFEGKQVAITGAGAGIGRVTALELVRLGARVAISDLDGDRAGALAERICESYGHKRAIGVACDVRDHAQVTSFVEGAIAHFGGLDVLINNAGTARPGPFADSTPDDWAFDVGICLYGVMNGVHAVLPHMVEQGGGRIVNCCSDAGRVGEPMLAAYSAAKAGVVGFTKAIAKEVGASGVHINCVCFGTTLTETIQELLPEEMRQKMVRRYPLGRLGTMEDQANAVLLLASDRASFITGQVLSSNGGYAMVG